ncbi:MAG: molecular chaperone DnaJ [Nitrospinota bacterium]|nr:molecular chaperone DnaJ [Nitrospinota bacterium]
MAKRDYYEVLNIGRNATESEIKKAYRTTAMQYHPDRNPGDTKAEELFKEASEAYQVLSDPQKRGVYDQYGHEGFSGGFSSGFSNVEDIFSSFGDVFSDIFGGGFGRRSRRDSSSKGRDLAYQLDLTFEESALGSEHDIEFEREIECAYCGGTGAKSSDSIINCGECNGSGQVAYRQGFVTFSSQCTDCGGSGKRISEHCNECTGSGKRSEKCAVKVKIPGGADHESRLRLREKGEGGTNGGPSGDLHVIVNLLSHERFEREGNNIFSREDVTFSQAALGGKIFVQTLYGESEVVVPQGVQSGESTIIKKQGFPFLGQNSKGDHIVVFSVLTPKELSSKEKKLFRELAKFEEQRTSTVKSFMNYFSKFDRIKKFFWFDRLPFYR